MEKEKEKLSEFLYKCQCFFCKHGHEIGGINEELLGREIPDGLDLNKEKYPSITKYMNVICTLYDEEKLTNDQTEILLELVDKYRELRLDNLWELYDRSNL